MTSYEDWQEEDGAEKMIDVLKTFVLTFVSLLFMFVAGACIALVI